MRGYGAGEYDADDFEADKAMSALLADWPESEAQAEARTCKRNMLEYLKGQRRWVRLF
jgi:hypothetical protein